MKDRKYSLIHFHIFTSFCAVFCLFLAGCSCCLCVEFSCSLWSKTFFLVSLWWLFTYEFSFTHLRPCICLLMLTPFAPLFFCLIWQKKKKSKAEMLFLVLLPIRCCKGIPNVWRPSQDRFLLKPAIWTLEATQWKRKRRFFWRNWGEVKNSH